MAGETEGNVTLENADATGKTDAVVEDKVAGQTVDKAAEPGAGKEAEATATETDTAADWRTSAANGDKGLEKLLKRFASPHGVAKALADTKAQLSKASTSSIKLADDATDEEKAEWRKARDIPSEAKDYDTTLKGVDWSDQDKAVIDNFTLNVAHKGNFSKEQVKAALQWYADEQVAQEQERLVQENKQKTATETALKAEYGADYVRNVGIMKEFGVSQLGQEVWDGLMAKRFDDGTRLGNHPAFVRLIVDAAMDRADGLPFMDGGGAGGMSDADLIKAHKELSRTAGGAGKEAKDAKAKMDDPDYAKRIEAAYERQARRDEAKSRAA